jgi:hypothetical protein
VKHLLGASTRQAQALPTKLVILIRLARDKHSSLLQKFINYGRKKVYNIGPRGHRNRLDALAVHPGVNVIKQLFLQEGQIKLECFS